MAADGVVPDVRDGLTPGCRRALWALGMARARGVDHRSSAEILDAVLAWPRSGGRRAIYRELVRMARDWELRHPLVDAQGDLGSMDGDDAEAAEHTAMRLAALGCELLRDAGDDSAGADGGGGRHDAAPSVLPARFPNLLVNGSFSIATGTASSIPPHNLREVVEATIACIDDPQIGTDELLRHVLGPDFPTGACVVGAGGLRDAYATGCGEIAVRARAHIEDVPARPPAVVVTELPFMVAKGGRRGVIDEIRRGARSRRIRGVAAIHDSSSEREGMRIVIELNREIPPDVVLADLYEHTRLECALPLKIVGCVGGAARTISLREVIGHYLDHRRAVLARHTGVRSESRLLEIVRDDLRDVAERFGDERRTEIG